MPREAGDDAEPLPPGPIVVMRVEGDGYAVLIDPALPTGDHRREFSAKNCAWSYARELWSAERIGFMDATALSYGRNTLHRKPHE
ncbi:MAG: hypothetical protein ACK4TC_06460 [Sphingomonas pseudosanguinis]|uniref:hypothetical protein n=1 Tax=Sphingomonas pseudosanguinis TaxID=413712 RepID=UPI0039191F62